MPSKASPLFPLLKQYGVAPYHICYISDNMKKAIAELTQQKFMLFKEPENAPVISSSAKVAFMISAQVGMIELVEE